MNEETKGAKKTPGLGAMVGIIFVFLLFEVFTIATNMVLTSGPINRNSADVLSTLGQQVWHGNAGKIIVLAVVLSTVATLETTLIQVTRTLFAMGRDNTLPKRLGTVHPKRKTPIFATGVVMVISLALFVGSQSFHSINSIMNDGINAIGLQICIYYCLAGLAVVMLYRKQLMLSASNFFFMSLWPFVGAVFMGYLFVKSIPTLYDADSATVWIGLGAMVLGLTPMFYYWSKHNPYYDMPAKEDRVAVLEEFEINL